MGLDVVLECENQFQRGTRSKIVHQSRCSSSRVEERYIKGQLASKYYHLRRLDGDFRELNLSSSPSPRRKSMPSKPPGVNVKDNEVLKRGSMYQSSREVRRMRKLREGKRNVEPALSEEAFLSFEIVDSLSQPSINEAVQLPHQKRIPLVSLNADLKSPSADTLQSVPSKSMELLELSFRDLPEERSKLSSSCSGSTPVRNSSAESLLEICLNSKELMGKESVEETKSKRNQIIGSETDGNILYGRETMCTLPKSFSANVGMSSSPCQSEREAFKASPKTRFSPFRRILDPIRKSRSLRNSSVMETEASGSTASDPPSDKRHRMFRKSLLNDFSKATQKMEYDGGLVRRDQVSTTLSSPAHLHAVLKLDCKHGAPSYEFAIKDPDDVLSAQTWRTDSAFNWVYTFHSCKKKNNSSSGWGTKDRHGQSAPMIGQMQVSCYLCSEVSDTGSLDNSAVTEFILYDIAHARQSLTFEDGSHCPSDSVGPPVFTVADSLVSENPLEANGSIEMEKYQHPVRRTSSDCDSDPSTSYPWAPSDLHPHREIAAIVIQIPFSKKESSKDTHVKETGANDYQNLLSASGTDEGDAISNCLSPANVKVVTPSGTHGLPISEEGRPSSLLDRWRYGGGCDCGGWDMACPIVVFDSPCADEVADYSALGSHRPMVLFLQGRKEKIPALSIMADGKGQYSVNFHAQLSSLQAFAICIAVLHSSEASSAAGQENKQRLYSNSLKLILEEEVRHLIEAVAEEEKRKAKKRVEQRQPSFFLDPPFSPMGRV